MKYVSSKQALIEILFMSLKSINNPAFDESFVGWCLNVGSLRSRTQDKDSGAESLFRWSQESQVRKLA